MPKLGCISILFAGMIVILAATGAAFAGNAHESQADEPISKSVINIYHDGVNEVPVSNNAINLIVSDLPIKNIKLPDSPHMDVSEGDNYNAYLEIQGDKPELIYVNTEKAVYAINLVPSGIGAQRLHLVYEKKEKVVLPLIGNERENVAVNLIKEAYREGEILERARTSNKLSRKIKFAEFIELMGYRRYEFEEDELVLTVYILRVEKDATFDRINITERMFLIPDLCENPLGISISRDYLNKTEFTRLFIVGRM